MHSGRFNKPFNVITGCNTWSECNELKENAKLVHLPGAVNCAGGADLAKCFQAKLNFNTSKSIKLKFDIHCITKIIILVINQLNAQILVF